MSYKSQKNFQSVMTIPREVGRDYFEIKSRVADEMYEKFIDFYTNIKKGYIFIFWVLRREN